MSIGWVIFWKAVVVAICAALWERWQTFKKRKSLNLVEVNGRYIPDPHWQRMEDIARVGFWIAFAVWNVFAFWLAYLFINT